MRPFCDYGYLPKYCGAFLEGLATTLPDPARIVEIGTGPGCSLRRLLVGLSYHRNVHVWSVDIKEIDVCERMRGISKDRYSTINGASVDVARNWRVPLDMVYIDGDHSYKECAADITAWTPLLKNGGIMAFDDYGFEKPGIEIGVQRAVDEILVADSKTWRLIGRIGRLVAFEKFTGETVNWHTNIAWLSEPGPLPFRAWRYLCLGLL